MKVFNLRINWNEDYNNPPDLVVEIDRVPILSELEFEVKILNDETRNKNVELLFAEKDGFCLYYVIVPEEEDPENGTTYDFRLKNGTIRKVKSPFSSNARTMSDYFIPCVDCAYNARIKSTTAFHYWTEDGYLAAISLEKLRPLLTKFLPDVAMLKVKILDYWHYSFVCKDGRPKPFAKPDEKILNAIRTNTTEPIEIDYPANWDD
jgi:hypothetical protein